MVIKGPGIAPGSTFDFPASNVDVSPTFLGLAGVDEYAKEMDGRSIVPLIVDPADPNVAPATRAHIRRQLALAETSAKASGHEQAAGAGGVSNGVRPSHYADDWRDFHFVEYYSLGNVTRTRHLVDDPISNTYRAIRSVKGSLGNMLYAEFTAVADWNFSSPSFYEMFDLDTVRRRSRTPRAALLLS